MECYLCYFSFIVFIVLICAPQTFGFWTERTGLPVPDPGAMLTCVDWITFYGFKEDNFNFNNAMAKNRHVPYDKDASTWAAMYAYELSGTFHEADFLPQIFCEKHQALDTEYAFLRLRDESKTCTDWLFLYGYTNDVRNNNRNRAVTRDQSLDEHIFLLVDGYGTSLPNIHSQMYFFFSPSKYCLEMGQIEGSLISFMNRLNTQLTCERWLKLYGYTDDAKYNYRAARKLAKQFWLYREILPWYVNFYSDRLKSNHSRFAESPKEFCRSVGYEDDETDFFQPLKSDFIPDQWYSMSTTHINERH